MILVSLFILIINSSNVQSSFSYWQPNTIEFVGNAINLPVEEIDFCEKDICITDASEIGLWMNQSVNICDDIYEYVCGSFQYFVSINN